ncbi:hypothetical protein [Saccharopolyspora sp. 5N708]|uniref:hypothetical protein n=1 Tax=Saccharopolyspora sp. 5N708 TaxID=3457424 RepID=UPI003FD653F8
MLTTAIRHLVSLGTAAVGDRTMRIILSGAGIRLTGLARPAVDATIRTPSNSTRSSNAPVSPDGPEEQPPRCRPSSGDLTVPTSLRQPEKRVGAAGVT